MTDAEGRITPHVSRFTLHVSRRVGRCAFALALGLGLFVLLSGWLGRATPQRALEAASEVGASASPAGAALLPDPRVAALMTQITTGTVVAYERTLTGEEPVIVGGRPYTLTTRNSYSGEPISQATRYVYERFQELGLDVAFHAYTWSGNHWRNVIAERPGSRRPDEIYLITAHLDDMPLGPVAPGADDNASGSSAVLVAAGLLGQLDLDCTLRFVLFTGEEQRLRGSAAYVTDTAAAGDDVRGVLNLDMIGYNSDAEPIVDLHARSSVSGSLQIATTFSQVVAAYGLNLKPEILVDDWLGNYSDNKSFWDGGYPAILAIEDQDDFTPYYHSINDTLDTLDLDYMTEFVRAGVGTFAHMGCLSRGLLSGSVTAQDTGLPLSATVTAIASPYVYTATTSADGHYHLALPVYTFTVQAQANLGGYYPAAVTGVAVRASPATVRHFVLAPWPYRVFVPILLKQP
jgi:hypothetical protein